MEKGIIRETARYGKKRRKRETIRGQKEGKRHLCRWQKDIKKATEKKIAVSEQKSHTFFKATFSILFNLFKFCVLPGYIPMILLPAGTS